MKSDREVFEDLIQTIERHARDNETTISNVELWAKSWREELNATRIDDKLRLFAEKFSQTDYFKTEAETVEEDYYDFNNEFEPLMKWNKFNPKKPPSGLVLWRFDWMEDYGHEIIYVLGYVDKNKKFHMDRSPIPLNTKKLLKLNAHWFNQTELLF